MKAQTFIEVIKAALDRARLPEINDVTQEDDVLIVTSDDGKALQTWILSALETDPPQ